MIGAAQPGGCKAFPSHTPLTPKLLVSKYDKLYRIIHSNDNYTLNIVQPSDTVVGYRNKSHNNSISKIFVYVIIIINVSKSTFILYNCPKLLTKEGFHNNLVIREISEKSP